MFSNDVGVQITLLSLQECWDFWWQDLDMLGEGPKLIQARQTWCVEMLMRGMSLENLSILTGSGMTELEPYAQRAREKAAIAAATQLDRKTPPS